MYKVFLNEKVILPGLQGGDFSGVSQLLLPVHCGIRAVHEALDRLLDTDGPAVLIIGKEGEEASAWQTLSAGMEQEFAAGGFVTDPLNHLLMIYRNGYWDLPKGKPHRGESIEATALREVEEETGIGSLYIQGGLGSSFHIFRRTGTWVLKESRWFRMSSPSGGPLMPQYEEGITEVRWVSALECNELLPELYPSLKDIVAKGWQMCGMISDPGGQ